MSELTERLREDWEMLKDGYQENLTKTWHNHAMTNAADDCAEAANTIEAQEALIAELTESLVWAMGRHAEPKLVRGQNEDYYNAWRKASLTLSKATSIK